MTPLAQRYANELTLPKKQRTLIDKDGVLPLVLKGHCFEMTAVMPACLGLCDLYIQAKVPDPLLAFLPAPLTWLEFVASETKRRHAYLLEQDGPESAIVIMASDKGLRQAGKIGLRPMLERCMTDPEETFIWNTPDIIGINFTAIAVTIYGMLATINSPHFIGRRTHNPHIGLQRKLARARNMTGKFPLRAWTEILLEATPCGGGDDAARETRLTGERAYHFVRTYLRRSTGKEVLWHYRGNPALGIVQSRYIVTGPLPESRP